MTTTSRAIEREARYHQNAYHFVYEALRFTQQSLNRASAADGEESEDAHISGVELLGGIREFGLSQFGLLTRTVFRHWGIRSTGDFGRIVFELISKGKMSKTDRDQLSDFFDVYDFEEAFDRNYQVDARKVFSR
jgi:uncharacterized repeat protein (TIGR04138 family)